MTQESRSTSGNQREPTPQLAREVKGMRDDSAPLSSTASASRHLVSASGSETKRLRCSQVVLMMSCFSLEKKLRVVCCQQDGGSLTFTDIVP